MKTLKFYFIGALLCALITPLHVKSQAVVKKCMVDFALVSGSDIIFEADDIPAIEVENPSGNYMKTIRIKIDQSEDIMDYFEGYPNQLFEVAWLKYDADDDGEYDEGDIQLIDAIAMLNKSGHLTIQFHLNGAGNYLPKGW